MAFVKVTKATGLGRATRTGQPIVRMGAHLHDGKTPRSIYLSITPEAIDQVGWTVDNVVSQRKTKDGRVYDRAACRIALNEGVGEDAGFLMLSEDTERGYTIGTTRGIRTAFTVNIGIAGVKHYTFNELPMDPKEVEFTIDPKDKTILIECPDWLRYNPESYTPAKEVPSTRPTEEVVVELEVKGSKGRPNNRHQRRQLAQGLARALSR